MSYDRMGRATKHQFGSDNTGNVHRLKWEYRYDDSNAGRLTGIASSNDDGLGAGSTAYAYDSHGRLSRVTLRNGAYTDYFYDRGGRPTRLANYHSAYDDGQGVTRRLSTAFDYNYDDNGNITEIVQDFVGAEVATLYGYDEINRLTYETTCDYMNQYYYDDGGNRTKLIHMNAVYSKDGNGRIVSMLTKASESNQGLTKTYYYANFTELTKMTASEYGGTTRDYTYEHDMAGRLTRQVQNVFSPNSTTTYNYEWDALDRMTKVQKVAGGVTKTINYAYNGSGFRVRRVDTSTNVTKLWTYQGANIASVQTSSGGAYGSDDWVYMVAPGMIRNALERHKLNGSGTDSRYYQYDHRGNTIAVTDKDGKILRGYQYDAFGNLSFSFQQGSSTPPSSDDILFTGKDYDEDTGLYYFNARWYDSGTGQYLSRSSLSPDKELRYGLCEDDPVGLVDPSGFWGTDVHHRDTYFTCRARGGSISLCLAIANADEDVDIDNAPVAYKPWNWHHHFPQTLGEVYGEALRAIEKCDIRAFGRALHRVQDFWSHVSRGNTGCNAWLPNHILQFWAPDDRNDPDNAYEFAKMMRWTSRLLRLYIEKCGKKC